MQAFGRMRLDVENCVSELVESGVVRRVSGDPVCYAAARIDPTSAQGSCSTPFSSAAPRSASRTPRRRCSASAR